MATADTIRDDIHEVINEHGHPQSVQDCGDGTTIPVCCQCFACVRPNRGQGMICDECDAEFSAHCAHDY